MAPKLTPEERVTLAVLKRKGQSNTQIAQVRVLWHAPRQEQERVPWRR